VNAETAPTTAVSAGAPVENARGESKGVWTVNVLQVVAGLNAGPVVTAAMVNATAVLALVIAAPSVRRIWVVGVPATIAPTFAVIPVVPVTAPAVIAEM